MLSRKHSSSTRTESADTPAVLTTKKYSITKTKQNGLFALLLMAWMYAGRFVYNHYVDLSDNIIVVLFLITYFYVATLLLIKTLFKGQPRKPIPTE
ncbi:hypothetical protein V6259_12610 [Marinomonas sp. TI.3.20]|uniref:hypothetical protein n=1 Tax=Marinomonas sp. TI.3.20 TaxID=3121296 RepID=UPI00311DA8ED